MNPEIPAFGDGDLARAGGVVEDDALVDRADRALRSRWGRPAALLP